MLCTSYNLQYLRPIRLRPVIKNPIECSAQIHINAGVHPYTSPPPTYTHDVPIFNLRKLFLTLIKIFLFLLQSFYNRKITNFCFNPAINTCCCFCCCVASVISDSVRPHRRQPTRLPRPWDSPGKNTGVGCHFLLQCMKVKSESEVA